MIQKFSEPVSRPATNTGQVPRTAGYMVADASSWRSQADRSPTRPSMPRAETPTRATECQEAALPRHGPTATGIARGLLRGVV